MNIIPPSIKNSAYPLTRLPLNSIEGIQKGIPLFHGVNIRDIAFVTKSGIPF